MSFLSNLFGGGKDEGADKCGSCGTEKKDGKCPTCAAPAQAAPPSDGPAPEKSAQSPEGGGDGQGG